MNKEMYLHSFQSNSVHEYRCPSCGVGILKLHGELLSEESVETKGFHSEDWFEVEHVRLNFACTLRCTNCQENVFAVGEGEVTEFYYDDENLPGGWGREFVKSFTPSFFQPPLQLIDFASGTPKEVALSLGKASAVYFSNPSTCCNNIRIAAEEVLSSLGIPEKATPDGRRLSFKDRIDLLPAELQKANVLFDAIRWLGNHGSHPGDGIGKEQALQAFEIMELLLEELFSNRRRVLHELALAINNAKGPI
ncbi:DUF4145 domain-containing protein [Pseudomonas protegens]|uniref:DUF4145 domain-containing protein n=1 Tax=Pseudomonas protegens TaxID=380021 RepID=UPI00160ADD99|nr:DUF4145 domain-containing protein [Pseudomonas protegens]